MALDWLGFYNGALRNYKKGLTVLWRVISFWDSCSGKSEILKFPVHIVLFFSFLF